MLGQALATWVTIWGIAFLNQQISARNMLAVRTTGGASSHRKNGTVLPPGSLNPLHWRFNPQCQPFCSVLAPRSLCSERPTREQVCTAKSNKDWCCKEWQIQTMKAPYFLPDCKVACTAYYPCPYPPCRVCKELRNKHSCCNDLTCPTSPMIEGRSAANEECDCDSDSTEKSTTPEDTEEDSDSDTTLSPWQIHCVTTDESTDSTTVAPPVTCEPPPDTLCRAFDGKPVECRLSRGCSYDCASSTCQNSEDVMGQTCFAGCFNHCEDKCGCVKRSECHYNDGQGTCHPLKRYCYLSDFSEEECGRKNGHYAIGGAICQNKPAIGKCTLDFTVIAANLGSDTNVTDTQGIDYRPQREITIQDRSHLPESISVPSERIVAVKPSDAVLYSTAVHSNSDCNKHSCVDYVIPNLDTDGQYELAIKLVEVVHSTKGARRFTAYFAGVEIFSELDIITYAGDRHHPVDIYVNFRVSNKGSMITIKGHPPEPLRSSVHLAFCEGQCGEDNSFLVSGFHIISQQPVKDVDSCQLEASEACTTEDFGSSKCIRLNSTYSVGGVYCRSEIESRNCTSATVLAVNLGGPRLEVGGITYQDSDSVRINDPLSKSHKETLPNLVVEGASEEAQGLYNSYLVGVGGKQTDNDCFWYDVPISEDGSYELAVNLMEPNSNTAGWRKFNVHFGHTAVFPEVDVNQLIGPKRALNLIIQFRVSKGGTTVRLRGFTNLITIPSSKTLPLAFCYSNCTNIPRNGMLVSAFSVVRFVSAPPPDKTCETHTDVCSCRTDPKCDFDVPGQKCVMKMKACKVNFDETGKPECRRGGEHVFYVDGGSICPNRKTQGVCKMARHVLAVNMNGNRTKSANGIRFDEDSAVAFEDPYKNKGTGIAEWDIYGVPPREEPIYQRYGMSLNGKPGECITYRIGIQPSEKFELTIKTVEYIYIRPNQRHFDIKLNNIFLVEAFEPFAYKIPPFGLDLNVRFKVDAEMKKLTIEGFPDSSIEGNQTIPLSFCPGSCTSDHNWVVGGFSVVTFANNE